MGTEKGRVRMEAHEGRVNHALVDRYEAEETDKRSQEKFGEKQIELDDGAQASTSNITMIVTNCGSITTVRGYVTSTNAATKTDDGNIDCDCSLDTQG